MSNVVCFNFTVLCMPGNGESVEFSGNQTHYAGYTRKEKTWLLSTVAIGAVCGVIPVLIGISKIGLKKVFFTSGMLTAFSTFLIPVLAPINFYFFIALRFMQGLSYAACFPAVGAITSSWASLAQQGLFIAALTTFGQTSSIFSMPVAGELCTSPFGWKSVFYLHSLISLAVFVIWFAIFTDSPRKLQAFFHPISDSSQMTTSSSAQLNWKRLSATSQKMRSTSTRPPRTSRSSQLHPSGESGSEPSEISSLSSSSTSIRPCSCTMSVDTQSRKLDSQPPFQCSFSSLWRCSQATRVTRSTEFLKRRNCAFTTRLLSEPVPSSLLLWDLWSRDRGCWDWFWWHWRLECSASTEEASARWVTHQKMSFPFAPSASLSTPIHHLISNSINQSVAYQKHFYFSAQPWSPVSTATSSWLISRFSRVSPWLSVLWSCLSFSEKALSPSGGSFSSSTQPFFSSVMPFSAGLPLRNPLLGLIGPSSSPRLRTRHCTTQNINIIVHIDIRILSYHFQKFGSLFRNFSFLMKCTKFWMNLV